MAAAPSNAQQLQARGDTPRRPYTVSPDLAFDPEETLPAFFARRQAAKDVGKQAWREGKINGDQLMVYEYLVDMVGAHRYGWKKERTMGIELNVPYSTLKRWIAKIEAVPLVRRERQFQTSSRTYITYYDQLPSPGPQHDLAPADAPPPAAQHPSHQDAPPQEDAPPSTAPSALPATCEQQDHGEDEDTRASFFGPEGEPSFGSFSDRQVKESRSNPSSDPGVNGGGTTDTFDITNVNPTIVALINEESVLTDRGKAIVAARPIEELRAVQQYIDTQRNIKDRAGFLVWAAETGFGADLLAGRVRAAERPPTPPTAAPRRRRARRTEPQPSAQKPESDYKCQACGHFSAYLGLDDGWCDRCGVHPGDELGKNDALTPNPELWAAVLDRLDVDDMHRDLWLAPTMIAHYAEYPDYIILACPHKLVRDAIRTSYLDCIEAAASTILGQPVRVDDVKVKYMPEVTAAQRAAWERSAAHDESTPIADEGEASSLLRRPASSDDPWPKMVAYINPPTEMSAIFERCYVAHQTLDHLLVIATPNCIVRDELRDTWLAPLHAAAGTVLGHAVDIELIIDGPPPILPAATDRRSCHVPAQGVYTEAHNASTTEQMCATACVAVSNAGKDAPNQEQHELGTEERERIWRAIPWRLQIRETERTMWFPHTCLHQCANGHATVTAPTVWHVEQLKRYQDLIEDELGVLLGQPITAAIVVADVATMPMQQEHDRNERVGSDAVNVVRSWGELDAVDHECPSAGAWSAPASEAVAAPHNAEAEYAATWEQVIAHLHLNDEERRTWLDPTMLVRLDDQRAVVAVPSVFIRRAIEHRYRTDLEEALSALLHRSVRVEVLVKHDLPNGV
jgi:chromosomal replication initiation ATPase DnaA